MNKVLLSIIQFSILSGCATVSGGDDIVMVGKNMYSVERLGSFVTFAGAEVKVQLYKDATTFCKRQGRELSPVSDSARDSGMGTYAKAKLNFRCVDNSKVESIGGLNLKRVVSSEEGVFYFDTSSRLVTGSVVRGVLLFNFTSPSRTGDNFVNSYKTINEYDCRVMEWRTRVRVEYSESMGKGVVVSNRTYDNERFVPVVPGTVGERLLNAVCSA